MDAYSDSDEDDCESYCEYVIVILIKHFLIKYCFIVNSCIFTLKNV